MCRLSLVAPQATHKAGFHPTAIFGAPAAAAAVGAALGLGREEIARALGISGSLASGIIEYLADGSSTKRLHAGAAAQAGLRAALLAEAGFTGPLYRLRGKSRPLQGLRAVEDAGFQTAASTVSGADWVVAGPCLQALCVRDDDPALRRLRHPPRRGRRARGRHRVDRVQGRRRDRASPVGAARKRSTGRPTAMPENSRRPIAWP